MARYPHLLLQDAGEVSRYKATNTGRDRVIATPPRDRAQHSAKLIGALQAIQQGQPAYPVQVGNGFYQSPGLTLSFESDPDFELAYKSLDLQGSNIQLLSIGVSEENRMIATVHVPDDKLKIFIRRLEAYREERKRDNKKLVESIANIKLATLSELWTDPRDQYPAANTAITWEVWLRRPLAGEQAPIDILRAAANDFGYEITSNQLTFVDRTVVLVWGTREQLARSVEVLGLVAELRKGRTTADFFSSRSTADQHEVADELMQRLKAPPENSPVVGLLDTGVNHAHPLLAPVMSDSDVETLKPAWGKHDTWHHGHGTQMAGLAIYGDLTDVLSAGGEVQLTHGVQSLKLIHEPDPHRPALFGTVTIEGISRLELEVVRTKVYCLAITALAYDRGRPSSWSAAIDNLACGLNDARRLILISAGNTGIEDRSDYPAHNESASIHDPAQSWNALTVGGYTTRAFINQGTSPGWTPLAAHGDLAPASTTSMVWPRSAKWPYKPDIVMEAGNMGSPPGGGDPDFLPELQVLTTNYQFAQGHAPFVDFHDTSAAVALAAHLATKLLAKYPDYTPETLRAMMVHSARWTDAMKARATDDHGKLDLDRLLRTFGYGAPDPEFLFYSAQNNLTLVAQDTIQPYFKPAGSNEPKTKDIKFHKLPWPSDVLRDLPFDTPIEMRVTLSYFVEPSPGERGWDRKYGYPSHGLRFRVMRPTEDEDEFKLRINAHDRDDDYSTDDHVDETGAWDLGMTGPTNGSIHSNVWRGSAQELADRGMIAVYPISGWWKTRRKEGRYENEVSYSLVVSITTPNAEVDIYTPVAVQVGVENVVEIET